MRKRLFFVGIIVMMLLSIIFLQRVSNVHVKNLDGVLDDYIYKISNEEFDYMNEDDISYIENYIDEILKDESDKEVIAKSSFILGYLDIIKFDLLNAVEKFNESIANLPAKIDSEFKVQVYSELSRAYLNLGDYEKSKEIFNTVIEFCSEEELLDKLITLSVDKSYDLYNIANKLNESIELMENILDICKEKDSDKLYQVYFELGILYWYDGRNIESINYNLKGLNIVYEKGENDNIPNLLIDVGIDYLDVKNYNEAIKYFLDAIKYDIKDKNRDISMKTYAYINLSSAYNKLNDSENAQKYYDMFYEIIDSYDNSILREQLKLVMNVNKADIEIRKGNPSEALDLLNESKIKYEEFENFYFYDFDVTLNELYGNCYYKMGEYRQALQYHKRAQEMALERNLTYLYEQHNEQIYLDYKALGDNENTIKYLEDNIKLKSDSKHSNDIQYSQYLMNEFQSEKKMNIITKLREQRRNMESLIKILVLIILIIIFFTAVIIKKNKEIKRLNKLFKIISETDGLTKILNRGALDTRLNNEWNQFISQSNPVSFIMIDIDYFKKYNDNYGHPKGDEVLRVVAETLKRSCRDIDIVARYGGEEFIIVMLNADKEKSILMAELIKSNINKLNIEHNYSETSNRVTLSMGIATAYSNGENSYKEYIQDADKGLYMAKQNGRNTYVHFDDI